ncbi:MAG TPA: cytochrome c peroxidase, partial [Polyangia bacterium]|nr:cytochrome c peroxidase [Polyangia bacterium]
MMGRSECGLLLALAASCDAAPPPAPLSTALAPPGFPAGPVSATAPDDNALTEARAQLGRRLFYDRRLSRTGEIACASCHRREHGFAGDGAISPGVEHRRGTRNAPGLANLAWSSSFFWDGRAATLEKQAAMPIENPLEMDLALPDAVDRLMADEAMVAAFTGAYGGPPATDTLPRALASFVRALVSGDSAYDRHLRGDDRDFGEPARRGEA